MEDLAVVIFVSVVTELTALAAGKLRNKLLIHLLYTFIIHIYYLLIHLLLRMIHEQFFLNACSILTDLD